MNWRWHAICGHNDGTKREANGLILMHFPYSSERKMIYLVGILLIGTIANGFLSSPKRTA